MIFDRVSYKRIFSLGNFENVTLHAEGSLEPGETVKEAWYKAKAEAESFHKESNPGLEYVPDSSSLPVIQWRDDK